jgi:hypothetical protein
VSDIVFFTDAEVERGMVGRPPEMRQATEAATVGRERGWWKIDRDNPAWARVLEIAAAHPQTWRHRAAPAAKAKPVPVAVPRDRWPFVVRVLAARAKAVEKGVGDTAKRLLLRMVADGLAWLYEKATGRPCGCADRQAKLNALYPYESEQAGAV